LRIKERRKDEGNFEGKEKRRGRREEVGWK
jgi:hypothetical protein